MGYSTEFTGYVTVSPPLNPAEIAYLDQFSDTRRMNRPAGPYATTDDIYADLGFEGYNRPPEGQPGLWCNWEPTRDGTAIKWNGVEKFYDADAWMAYLIDHFLQPGGKAQGHPGFEDFTFDHVVNGEIKAQGEDPDDTWTLHVTSNAVTRT
ncbi:hypothetical protein [Streptomyces rubiginosohelvolus]|uniref:hypothetical protein n=1 Tax=Streptomyces rubiginosohelvolus TaxID=67362 RepID=UPI003651D9A6